MPCPCAHLYCYCLVPCVCDELKCECKECAKSIGVKCRICKKDLWLGDCFYNKDVCYCFTAPRLNKRQSNFQNNAEQLNLYLTYIPFLTTAPIRFSHAPPETSTVAPEVNLHNVARIPVPNSTYCTMNSNSTETGFQFNAATDRVDPQNGPGSHAQEISNPNEILNSISTPPFNVVTPMLESNVSVDHDPENRNPPEVLNYSVPVPEFNEITPAPFRFIHVPPEVNLHNAVSSPVPNSAYCTVNSNSTATGFQFNAATDRVDSQNGPGSHAQEIFNPNGILNSISNPPFNVVTPMIESNVSVDHDPENRNSYEVSNYSVPVTEFNEVTSNANSQNGFVSGVPERLNSDNVLNSASTTLGSNITSIADSQRRSMSTVPQISSGVLNSASSTHSSGVVPPGRVSSLHSSANIYSRYNNTEDPSLTVTLPSGSRNSPENVNQNVIDPSHLTPSMIMTTQWLNKNVKRNFNKFQ